MTQTINSHIHTHKVRGKSKKEVLKKWDIWYHVWWVYGTRGYSQPNLIHVFPLLGPSAFLDGAFVELGSHSYTSVIRRVHRWDPRRGWETGEAEPPHLPHHEPVPHPPFYKLTSKMQSAYFCKALRFCACVLCSIIMTVVDYIQDKCQRIGNLINCNTCGVSKSPVLMIMVYKHINMKNI